MSILEKEVLITIHNKTIKHYEDKGYDIPKHNKNRVNYGTKILVKVEDLPKGSNVKLTNICDNCGKQMLNKPYVSIILQREKSDGKDRCIKCSALYSNKTIRENIPYERSLEHFAKENNMEYLLDEYSDKNPIQPNKIFKACNDECYWICNKCGSEFVQKVNTRTCYGCGCPYCAGMKVNETNSLEIMNPELTKEWHPINNGELSPNNVHYISNKKVWWRCSENPDHEWEARIETRASRKYGCPICAESKGEKRIRKWLEEYEFLFSSQKEYEGLIGTGGGNLSYDFHIPKLNILIEYQGEFHDGKLNNYVRQNLEYQKEHDKRKKEYAVQNNIELFEIWYWDFDNVEKILESKLLRRS